MCVILFRLFVAKNFLFYLLLAGMEKIVFGLQKITFRENCEEILTENRNVVGFGAGWNCPAFKVNKTMSVAMLAANDTVDRPVKSDEEEPALDEDDPTTSAARYSLRKATNSRASKENALHKIQRRTIARPAKKTKTFTLCTEPSDIKKIYTTRSLSNFRPTNLETIFEEPQAQKSRTVAAAVNEAGAGTSTSVSGGDLHNLIGGRKLRRSLSCSDGTSTTKTVIKHRRAKIKRLFGRRCAFKKIALEDFMQHMKNSSLDTESADESDNLVGLVGATASAMEESELSD